MRTCSDIGCCELRYYREFRGECHGRPVWEEFCECQEGQDPDTCPKLHEGEEDLEEEENNE